MHSSLCIWKCLMSAAETSSSICSLPHMPMPPTIDLEGLFFLALSRSPAVTCSLCRGLPARSAAQHQPLEGLLSMPSRSFESRGFLRSCDLDTRRILRTAPRLDDVSHERARILHDERGPADLDQDRSSCVFCCERRLGRILNQRHTFTCSDVSA